jgi:hypothetical protein
VEKATSWILKPLIGWFRVAVACTDEVSMLASLAMARASSPEDTIIIIIITH